MNCYECLRKDYCPYIHQFNHDKNVGCIDFQDRDHITYITNTLNVGEDLKMSKELEAIKYLKENKRKHWLDNDESNECLDILETSIKSSKKKLDIIGEILVDISKGNYADLDVAIDEIREVLG